MTSTATEVRINPRRLRRDLDAVNALGRVEGLPGINRPSFSDADMAGRRWLMARLRAADLEAWMDGVGNVFGRWNVGSGAPVLAGSHLDTVPAGGPFDGTLGVLASLEAVRAMRDAGIEPVRPIEVVCTADEEGRFGGMLGSQALLGEVDGAWIRNAVDESGRSLVDTLRAQGLDPETTVVRAPETIGAFLELHIEQGPVLATAGNTIGVVEAVSGVFDWSVTLTGDANHSGTTPMHQRRDAFRGLAEFGSAIPAILELAGGPESRLTVGKVELRPDFPHSIPGVAVFSIIGRDPDEAVLHRLAGACRDNIAAAAARHALEVDVQQRSWLPPTSLDTQIADRIIGIAAASGVRYRRMASGAGHDVQTFARHTRAGLIFVPSVGGKSHAPDEWTEWQDVEAGATIFARALADLASNQVAPTRSR